MSKLAQIAEGSSGEKINVLVKLVRPSDVEQEFQRGEREGKAKTLEVAVRPDATVLSVKAIVQDREDVPLEWQQLVFGGGVPDNTRTLASIGVRDGHTLFITITTGVNIFVKLPDGTRHTIKIHLSDSVAALKVQASKLVGCSKDAVNLLFAGRLLGPDSASLSSLNVQKEAIIVVMYFQYAVRSTSDFRMTVNTANTVGNSQYDGNQGATASPRSVYSVCVCDYKCIRICLYIYTHMYV